MSNSALNLLEHKHRFKWFVNELLESKLEFMLLCNQYIRQKKWSYRGPIEALAFYKGYRKSELYKADVFNRQPGICRIFACADFLGLELWSATDIFLASEYVRYKDDSSRALRFRKKLLKALQPEIVWPSPSNLKYIGKEKRKKNVKRR